MAGWVMTPDQWIYENAPTVSFTIGSGRFMIFADYLQLAGTLTATITGILRIV